jgi:hypothetical protein
MAVLDDTSPVVRRALNGVFRTLAHDPDVRLEGMVRSVTRSGAIDIWIRRGPILLRGSAVWTRLYMVVPYDAPVTIYAGETPRNAVDVTVEEGPWAVLFGIAAAQLPNEITTAIRKLSMDGYTPQRVDAAQMACRRYVEAHGRDALVATSFAIELASRKGGSRAKTA